MDPDPNKEIEVDPDPDLDPERGLKWIRIRLNAVDPDPDPKRCLQELILQLILPTLCHIYVPFMKIFVQRDMDHLPGLLILECLWANLIC